MLFSEPKIPQLHINRRAHRVLVVFQCSSASRKFLKSSGSGCVPVVSLVSVLFSEPKIPQIWQRNGGGAVIAGFSALQRAENSSNHPLDRDARAIELVSVLFSEPKIPQIRSAARSTGGARTRFQCSSASRKFLKCIEIKEDVVL